MKYYFKLLLSLLFIPQILLSQKTNLSTLLVPKELTENSNAIIRLNQIDVTIEDVDKLTIKGKRVVTVLNKLGNQFVDLYHHYNNDTKINGLSAVVYDANGEKVKKYGKSKFKDYSAVSGGAMYTDSRVKALSYTPTRYPYTIEFNYEVATKTTGFIPKWFPLENWYIAVEKDIYIIHNTKKIPIHLKEQNFDGFQITNKSTDEVIRYEMANQKSIRKESYSPSLRKLFPSLMVSLEDFSLKGHRAHVENWSQFGKWMRTNLYEKRAVLSQETQAKAKALVSGIEDPIEKAKIIYKHVQDNTRYVNVSIGIGGWQPSPAQEVADLGYGDCKGLTNYTKALLDAVDVKSNWTIVYAGSKRNIDKDFTSIQGNHMILNIPNNGDDIWLECTSQKMPFGFIGDFTDDRDVLVLTEEGGVIKHTQAYLNENNLQESKNEIHITAKGDLQAHVEILSKGIQYDNRYKLDYFDNKELHKHYLSNYWDYNNNLSLENISIQNNKDSASIKEDIHLSINGYASIVNNDMLFRVNVFNKYEHAPAKYRNRKMPFKISRGFKDVDSSTFNLPEGYKITMLPAEISLKSKFGNYHLVFEKINDRHFTYKRTFSLNEGDFAKEDYGAYRKFLKSVVKKDNLRISISKI